MRLFWTWQTCRRAFFSTKKKEGAVEKSPSSSHESLHPCLSLPHRFLLFLIESCVPYLVQHSLLFAPRTDFCRISFISAPHPTSALPSLSYHLLAMNYQQKTDTGIKPHSIAGINEHLCTSLFSWPLRHPLRTSHYVSSPRISSLEITSHHNEHLNRTIYTHINNKTTLNDQHPPKPMPHSPLLLRALWIKTFMSSTSYSSRHWSRNNPMQDHHLSGQMKTGTFFPPNKLLNHPPSHPLSINTTLLHSPITASCCKTKHLHQINLCAREGRGVAMDKDEPQQPSPPEPNIFLPEVPNDRSLFIKHVLSYCYHM